MKRWSRSALEAGISHALEAVGLVARVVALLLPSSTLARALMLVAGSSRPLARLLASGLARLLQARHERRRALRRPTP